MKFSKWFKFCFLLPGTNTEPISGSLSSSILFLQIEKYFNHSFFVVQDNNLQNKNSCHDDISKCFFFTEISCIKDVLNLVKIIFHNEIIWNSAI